jgi:TP901 family phage tail tape measure protein
LAILVKAKDLATPILRSIGRETKNLNATVGRGLKSLGRNIERGLVIAGGAAVAGIGYALKAAGDFEAQLNTINTVAMKSPEALKQIGSEIRGIARDTGTVLEDLTTGYYDLVSAGIDASQATDVLRNANTLAIGGLSTTAESVDLLTTALNSYGVEAKNQGAESQRFADIFAKAIERGKVTAAELASSFANIGPIAAANGIEIEELAASYAELTARGVPAAEASTQMASALVALMRRTGDLEKLEKQTGKSYLAIAGEKGLVAALQQLREDGEAAGTPLIDLLGRIEGLQFVTNTTGEAFDSYNESLAAMTNANGTAADQMSERQQGLNFQLARLKALAHDAAITVGDALLPKIVPKIKELVEWLASHQDKVAQFADDVADGFDEVASALGKVDWKAVGAGLGVAKDVALTLLNAFLKMPAWVQTAVVTGWGLNKLTGGMIGTLLGQLSSGIIKGVLGINAGVVNVRGAVVNGGVGAPVAGGKGLLGKAGGFLVGLSGAAIVAAIADTFEEPSEELASQIHNNSFLKDTPLSGLSLNDLQWPFGPKNTPTILPELFGGNGLLGGNAEGTSAGRSRGGSFGPPVNPGADAASADAVLTRAFGGKIDKIATNEVIQQLGRTTEMGLKGVGTSIEQGVMTGMDPIGDTATRILASALHPKAPAVMDEIQGHIAGLEEIQKTYLDRGDVALAAKVQRNIDTLSGLIGTVDKVRAVTEMQKQEAASADAAMLNSARNQTDRLDSLKVTQSEALAAVRATNATLATKNFSPLVKVSPTITTIVNISTQEWMRTQISSIRAESPTGFI